MLTVERIQKRMLRKICEAYDSPYEGLLSKSHMTTQECQRTRSLAIEGYKAVNDMTPTYT